MNESVPKEELEAALALRREQGPEIESALVDSLAAKVDATVHRAIAEQEGRRSKEVQPKARVAVCIVSIVMAIPLMAIVGSMLGLPGVISVWVGLIALNLALRPNSD